MLTNNASRSRQTARLGLESLEGRIALSTTPLAPLATTGHVATASTTQMQITHQTTTTTTTTTQQAVTYAHFGYGWGLGKEGAVILGTNTTTGNHKSTGSVDLALVRGGLDAARVGGAPVSVPVGFALTTSSASAAAPDHFNSTFTVTLKLKDASGASAVLTFHGRITGTLTWGASHLTATFLSPTTQTVTLGHHKYVVTMPAKFTPTGPQDMPVPLFAKVSVSSVK
jgi:hypothetical protein